MNHDKARELLKKFRLGQCNSEELDLINLWFDSYDDEEDLIDNSDLQSVKRNMLAEINDQINQTEKNSNRNIYSQKSEKKVPFLNAVVWLKYAALIVLGVGFIFYLTESNKGIVSGNTIIDEGNSTVDLPSTIYLADGTVIYLKEDSHLEYPDNFTGSTREVTLTGEAFFKVAKDENKPFIIYSNSLITKVLGTSFNIKAYEYSDSLEVSVVTGKVSVSINNEADRKDNKEVVLNSNQKVIYTRNNNELIQAKVKDSVVFKRIERRKLIFNDTPLDNIVEELNSYYDIEITLSNRNMKNCHITAELSDEPLEISLLILAKAIGADYEIKDKEIIIKGKGCGILN